MIFILLLKHLLCFHTIDDTSMQPFKSGS